MGKIVKESNLDYVRGKFSRTIPHPSLITPLCIKGGVKFNEGEEERCPKASPLTLAGVLKALVKSKEGEKREKPTKKRKRAEIAKQPREPAPTTVFEEKASSEEIGILKHIQSSKCSPLLQTRGHQLQLELKKEEKTKLQLKKAAPLNRYPN